MKKNCALLLSVVLLLGLVLCGCGSREIGAGGVLDQGTLYSSGGYQRTFVLSAQNGGYVTLWVENHGNNPVMLLINGTEELRLDSGKSGEVTAVVRDHLFGEREYDIRCVTAAGDDVDISYRIHQHGEQK